MRGKAQRVARPACANATVHFLLTYTIYLRTSHLLKLYAQLPASSPARLLAGR